MRGIGALVNCIYSNILQDGLLSLSGIVMFNERRPTFMVLAYDACKPALNSACIELSKTINKLGNYSLCILCWRRQLLCAFWLW